MIITNLKGLPAPMFEAVQANPYSRGKSDISVTDLIDSPRLVALREAHSEELTSDTSDLMWSLMGQVMHGILERAGIKSGKGDTETRLYAKIKNWIISGQYDYIDEQGVLWDWKFVSVYEYINGIKTSRAEQLNTYAYLASLNNQKVTGLRVGFVFRDWSPRQAQNDRSYPQSQAMEYSIPLWSLLQQKLFVEQRVELHQAARQVLPECSKKDRWQQDDKWAVTKQGNKRADRLFDNLLAAQAHARIKQVTAGNTYNTEHRPGVSTRCALYCPVLDYCTQGKALVNGSHTEEA